MFGAGVEPQQALTLGNALPDQLRIDALQACQNDQLLEACFITDIAWAVRVCLPPFLCSNTNRATFRASASPAQVRLSRRRDISQCANVLPFLPALGKIPIALGRVAPLFRRRGKYVGPSLHLKPVEFDGFRAKVVELRILDMKKVNICLMFLDYSLDGSSSSRFACSAVLSIISMTTWLSCAAFFDVMTDFPVSASMACLA